MAGVTGVDFILAINTGTSGSPVYTDIGGQRNATLNLGLGTTDVTTKDSSNWEESLPTIRNWSIDFDALLLETDTGFLEVEDWYMNRTQLQVRFTTAASNTYTGNVTVTSVSMETPHDGEAVISGTLQGTGALTKA